MESGNTVNSPFSCTQLSKISKDLRRLQWIQAYNVDLGLLFSGVISTNLHDFSHITLFTKILEIADYTEGFRKSEHKFSGLRVRMYPEKSFLLESCEIILFFLGRLRL